MGGVTILTATATLDFPSTTAQNNNALTITVTGCAVGDVVILGIPTAAIPATNHVYTAWVSSVNTVSVRFSNNGASTVDPSSGTFTIKVIK